MAARWSCATNRPQPRARHRWPPGRLARRSVAAFETEFEDGVKVSDLAGLDVDAFISFVIDDRGLSTETLVAAAFDRLGT